MKKGLLLFLTCLFQFSYAQDVIYKCNGDEIQARVAKITDSEIEYKKWSNPNGPVYTIKTSDVFMIKYENGEKDVFTENLKQSAEKNVIQERTQPKQPMGTCALPAGNNAKVIERERLVDMVYTITPVRVKYLGAIAVCFTDSSVVSTDEVDISILSTIDYELPSLGLGLYVKINNKTGNYVYIDRAGSTAGGASYYNSKQIMTTTGSSINGGAGVNLGGVANALGVGGVVGSLANAVGVGGSIGSSKTTTEILGDDRILTIAPMASSTLTRTDLGTDKKGGYKEKMYEWTWFDPKAKDGETKIFSEENTPWKRKFIITYSTDPTFAEYKTLVFEIYQKGVIKQSSKYLKNLGKDDEEKILKLKPLFF